MKVWIAFQGWDYEGETIIGVYTNFDTAVSNCYEDMGGDVSSYTVTDKRDGKFHANRGSHYYFVQSYEVE